MLRHARILMAAIAALAVVLALAAGAVAGGDPDHPSTPPAEQPADRSLGEWLGQSWADVLAIPADENPLLGNGEQCVPMDEGRVIAPTVPPQQTELTCTVREGTRVLVLGLSAECSNVEPPPFFAETFEQALECARENVAGAGLTVHRVLVDGVPFDLLDAYGVTSPYMTVELPEGNILTENGEPATARFAAFGYALMVGPLDAGRHRITILSEAESPDVPPRITFTINVVPQDGHKRKR